MMKICNLGQVAHQAGAYPGFYSMKQLRVFLLPPPPGWDARSITGLPPSIKFTGTYLHTWVEKGTVRVKCDLPKNTLNSTQCPRPGLEPGPLALESSALTMRPMSLPPYFMTRPKFQYPIYDHSVATVSVPTHTHNFRKLFLNNIPVQFKTKVQKPYPLYERNGQI